MPQYYFHSLEKERGDREKKAGNYDVALIYYNQALARLNHIRAVEKDTLYTGNTFAAVLSSIIECSLQLAFASLATWDYQQISNFKEKLLSDLTQLTTADNSLSEMAQNEREAIKRKEAIYPLLAIVSEAISERITYIGEAAPTEENFLIALEWLKEAKQYLIEIEYPIPIKMHLKHLNLLEKAFKVSENQDFLIEMQSYITSTDAFMALTPYSLDDLEFFNYQLVVAIGLNKPDKAKALIQQYQSKFKLTLLKEQQLVRTIEELIQENLEQVSSKKRLRENQQDTEIWLSIRDANEITDLEEPAPKKPKIKELVADKQKRAVASDGLVRLQAPGSDSFFFIQSVPLSIPTTEISYSQAFSCAIKAVAQQYSIKDLWAELLVFIANFYSQHCPSSIALSSNKADFIAYSLYIDALMINPECANALRLKNDLSKKMQPLFSARRPYANNLLECFNQAIENHIDDVTAMIPDKRKREEFFSLLFPYLLDCIPKYCEPHFSEQIIELMKEEHFNNLEKRDFYNIAPEENIASSSASPII